MRYSIITSSFDGKLTEKVLQPNGKMVDVVKGYTTGNMSSNTFVKTIYDPDVWTDAKLEKALKEALQDVLTKEHELVNGKSYKGFTSEGYEIEFWYRENKIQTFYFIPNK
jgi:hypothetical protein